MFGGKTWNESITEAACAVVGLVLAWPFLSSERAGSLEPTSFLIGLFGGFVAFYSHTLREGLMERSSRSGQERGFPLLRFLTVAGSPLGGLLVALMARLLSFSNEVAIALAGPYCLGSCVVGLFLALSEVVVKRMLEDEES